MGGRLAPGKLFFVGCLSVCERHGDNIASKATEFWVKSGYSSLPLATHRTTIVTSSTTSTFLSACRLVYNISLMDTDGDNVNRSGSVMMFRYAEVGLRVGE